MNEIFQKKLLIVNKPGRNKEKMLEGKIKTYFKEKTFTGSNIYKKSDETISQLLDKKESKNKKK